MLKQGLRALCVSAVSLITLPLQFLAIMFIVIFIELSKDTEDMEQAVCEHVKAFLQRMVKWIETGEW